MSIHILKLEEISWESPTAASFHFHQAIVDRIHFLPGQFITLKVEIEGKFFFRSYSISSAPRLDDVLSITIKRVEGGLVSNYLLDHYKAGQLVEFLSPQGRFLIQNSIKNERRLILFAGGSGITPIMSILRSTLYNEPKSKVNLFYASKDKDSIIFRQRLEDLVAKFPERLAVHHILSQENQELDFSYTPGRLTAASINTLLSNLHEELRREYYICGPTGMMELVYKSLLDLQVPKSLIHQERFVATEQHLEAQIDYEGPSTEVEVILGSETHKIQVPPGSTVLRSAIDQQISLPHSCLRGICASCMGQLLQGEVRMLNNETLLEFEIERGKVLVCQSQPTSKDVKIRMGAEA